MRQWTDDEIKRVLSCLSKATTSSNGYPNLIRKQDENGVWIDANTRDIMQKMKDKDADLFVARSELGI